MQDYLVPVPDDCPSWNFIGTREHQRNDFLEVSTEHSMNYRWPHLLLSGLYHVRVEVGRLERREEYLSRSDFVPVRASDDCLDAHVR